MSGSDGEHTDGKISPRDGLKVIGAGVGGAVAAGLLVGGVKNIWEILGENKPFAMANKICGSIVRAEVQGDTSSELTARKAALSWIFAETAVIVAPYVGYDSASQAHSHYLYGNGELMDMSQDMSHLSSDKSFWNQMFAKGFNKLISSNFGDTSTILDSKFKSALEFFIAEVKNGVKFQTQTPKEGISEKLGLFYTVGTSEYQLKADKAEIVTIGEEGVALEVEKARLTMRDAYDWTPGDFNPGIKYLSRITGLVMDEAFRSLGLDRIVQTVLTNSGVPEWQRQLLYENYLESRGDLSSRTSSILSDAARRLEKAVMGRSGDHEVDGHYDFDLSLLTDYGARPFPISATIDFDGEKIEMPIAG